MELKSLAGLIIFAREMDAETVKWSDYRSDMVDHSDFRKFGGMLRMVMDGKQAQAEALLTCIVQSSNGNHLHFVDGSSGIKTAVV